MRNPQSRLAFEARAAPPMDWQPLRALTLPAGVHPHGQPHLSAASGLVCAFGRAYVVADDEQHLGIFDGLRAPGRLHRVLDGDLPSKKGTRKKKKADLEVMVLLPPGTAPSPRKVLAHAEGGCLWMLGSGSAPGRDRAVLQGLDRHGDPLGLPQVIDLFSLYEPLRQRLGSINIEGAIARPGRGLWLFNRGGNGQRGANAVVRYAWTAVLDLLAGKPSAHRQPEALVPVNLGQANGVGYGFTDAAAWPSALGEGCLFTAVAEASDNHVADGACTGSALGCLGPEGELLWLKPLRGAPKVEGLAWHAAPRGLKLCLATDADDPDVASQLLLAQLQHMPNMPLHSLRAQERGLNQPHPSSATMNPSRPGAGPRTR